MSHNYGQTPSLVVMISLLSLFLGRAMHVYIRYHPSQNHGGRNVPLGLSFLKKPVSGLTISWVEYVENISIDVDYID